MELLIDTSGSKVYIGLLDGSHFHDFLVEESPVLEGLFSAIDELLGRNDLAFSSLESIIYCSGPGSLLGLRVLVTFLKTLVITQPDIRLGSYESLIWLREKVQSEEQSFDYVVMPWKKGNWNVVSCSNETAALIEVWDDDQLNALAKKSLLVKQRKLWKHDFEFKEEIEYSITGIEKVLAKKGFVTWDNQEIKMYLNGVTEFKKWSCDRHR